MNRVDVIVPSYKYGHYLPGCLNSVLGQEGVELRVLVIDDASPDSTADVARAFAARDSRVELLQHARNKGAVATFNDGLDWARNEYTLLISADDMLTPGALARAVAVLDAHPDVGFASGAQILFQDHDALPPSLPSP